MMVKSNSSAAWSTRYITDGLMSVPVGFCISVWVKNAFRLAAERAYGAPDALAIEPLVRQARTADLEHVAAVFERLADQPSNVVDAATVAGPQAGSTSCSRRDIKSRSGPGFEIARAHQPIISLHGAVTADHPTAWQLSDCRNARGRH